MKYVKFLSMFFLSLILISSSKAQDNMMKEKKDNKMMDEKMDKEMMPDKMMIEIDKDENGVAI